MLQMILLDTFAKSLILLCIFGVITLVLHRTIWRQRDVESEHRLWVLLLLAMYFLPFSSMLLPELRLPVPAWVWAGAMQSDNPESLSISRIPLSEIESARTQKLNTPVSQAEPIPLSGSVDQQETGGLVPKKETVQSLPGQEFQPNDAPISSHLARADRGAEDVTQPERKSESILASLSNVFLNTSMLRFIWAAGSLVLVVRLLASIFQVNKLSKQSEEIELPDVDFKLPSNTKVYENAEIQSPAVVGCFSFKIILPLSWTSWSQEKLRSVLAHESSHIRRLDGLVSLLSDVNSIVHWPNPASWFIKVRLSRLSEFACDQAGIESAKSRKVYAKHLLEIAALNSPPAGIAMASGSEISKRIDRILASAGPIARRASWLFLFALIVLGIPSICVIAAIRPFTSSSSDSSIIADDMSGHSWYREEGDKKFLRFQLRVRNPDGTLAEDVNVRVRSRDSIETTWVKDHFEFEFEHKPGFQPGIRVLATSSDGKLIGSYAGGYDATTHDAKNGIEVQLEPSRSIQVRVVDDGKVVSNAKVGIDWVGGFETFATTNERGEATFRISRQTTLKEIGAVTDDGRIGGYQFAKKPVRDPNAPIHEIELHNCHGRTIRVVDKQNKPLSGITFDLHIADKQYYNYIPLFDNKTYTTDENGEAFCPWFPDWEVIHTYINLVNKPSWSKIQDDVFEDGVLVSRLEKPSKLERVKVSGQVNLPEGLEHSFLVKLGSFEHPEEHRSDSLFCRTDSRGKFTAEVMPGATYCAFVMDTDWVSNYWSGVPFDADTDEFKEVELDIMKGEPVEVVATVGPNRRPLANLTLSLSQAHRFDWKEAGEKRTGLLGRQWFVKTDEQGKVLTYANLGEIKAWVSDPEWQPEVKSEVKPGVPTRLEFHRKSPGKRMVMGRVLVPTDVDTPAVGYQVKLIPMDGESQDEETAITDSFGNFQAEISAAIVGAAVRSPDGKLFAKTITDDPDSGIDLELEPTTTFRGTYVDQDGKPVAGKWVRIEPDFRNPDVVSSHFVEDGGRLDPIETTTDNFGEFELRGVPYDIRLVLSCEELENDLRQGVSTDRDGVYLGTRYLQRNENRPPEVIQPSRAVKPPGAIKSLESHLETKLLDSRLIGARLLVALQGPGEEAREFTQQLLNNTDEIPELVAYLPAMWIDTAAAMKNPERKALFANRDWQATAENELVLRVLESNGREIAQIGIDVRNDSATQQAKQFLTKHIGQKRDARRELQQAKELAKKTGRKVWIRFSQTRCGPCYRFARWIERNRAELEQGFVFVKVDNTVDVHGGELFKEMTGGKLVGIPYHQILKPDGGMVIDSIGKLGNIGHPSSFEGIDHLKFMLRSHPGFSSEQIEKLVQDAREGS